MRCKQHVLRSASHHDAWEGGKSTLAKLCHAATRTLKGLVCKNDRTEKTASKRDMGTLQNDRWEASRVTPTSRGGHKPLNLRFLRPMYFIQSIRKSHVKNGERNTYEKRGAHKKTKKRSHTADPSLRSDRRFSPIASSPCRLGAWTDPEDSPQA